MWVGGEIRRKTCLEKSIGSKEKWGNEGVDVPFNVFCVLR
jgi:hypothetical protein